MSFYRKQQLDVDLVPMQHPYLPLFLLLLLLCSKVSPNFAHKTQQFKGCFELLTLRICMSLKLCWTQALMPDASCQLSSSVA